ncbi:MAG: hypothetical protein ACI85V_001541 [bacterium]|jgi:hypothetical protein
MPPLALRFDIDFVCKRSKGRLGAHIAKILQRSEWK